MTRSRSLSVKSCFYLFSALILVLLGIGLAWSLGSFRSWLDIHEIISSLQQLGKTSGAFFAICGFILACTFAIPITFLKIIIIVAFGPIHGAVYSLIGSFVSSAISFGLGRLLGKEVVRQFAGERINEISQKLGRRGLLSAMAMRFIPVVPFAISNMIAGTSHIRLRDFLIGSTLGLIPTTILIAVFINDFIIILEKKGGLSSFIPIALIIVVLFGGIWMVKRFRSKN